jgi:hypothetical protein
MSNNTGLHQCIAGHFLVYMFAIYGMKNGGRKGQLQHTEKLSYAKSCKMDYFMQRVAKLTAYISW